MELTPQLSAALSTLTRVGNQQADTFSQSSTAMTELLSILDQAKAAFADAPRTKLKPSATLVEGDTSDESTDNGSDCAAGVEDGEDTPLEDKACEPRAEVASEAKCVIEECVQVASSIGHGKVTRAPDNPSYGTESVASPTGWLRLQFVRGVVTSILFLLSVVDVLMVCTGVLYRAGLECITHMRSLSLAPGIIAHPGQGPRAKVVIVGGSFSGLRAQRELSSRFDVTVVDIKEYFEYTPGVLRLFTQPENLGKLVSPLPTARSNLVVGEATTVTPTHLKVRVSQRNRQASAIEGACSRKLLSSDEETVMLPYDYLLLGCGAGYPCAPIKPTSSECTLTSRQATWTAAATTLRTAADVIVVGAGLVGVELAGEIAEAYPTKRTTVVTSGGALCSALPPRVGKAVGKWLAKRGVHVRFHSPVMSLEHEPQH